MSELNYQHRKTQGGIIFDSYTHSDKKDDVAYVLLAGLNVDFNLIFTTDTIKEDERLLQNPNIKDSYLGKFPVNLADMSKRDVFVVYQPAMSLKPNRTGFYSEKTSLKQLETALELTTSYDNVYPITHSLSTVVGTDALLNEVSQNLTKKLLPGTISSVFTNAKDALTTEKGKSRKLSGVFPWYFGFKAAEYFVPSFFPFALPIYPLAAQQIHDGGKLSTEKHPHWGASKMINPATAKYVMKVDTSAKAQGKLLGMHMAKKPLFLITTEDRIFDAQKQEQIANQFRADKVFAESGHRWFTLPDNDLNELTEKIISHQKGSLEERLIFF